MAQLTFETLSFRMKDDMLQVTLLKLFDTLIPISELNAIGPFKVVDKHTIEFEGTYEHKSQQKFSGVLSKNFDNLKNKLTGNHVTYVHRNSGIPLIGNVAFGIVYRNSSILEIKPVTSCNLDCIYCSISEGLSSKKNDFVVEMEYMVEELQKVLDFVNEPLEIHIGVQGEPFLYEDMTLLIERLQEMEMVHTISIDTNGTLLTEKKIDVLAKNSKLQINMSLDAINPEVAKKIAGVKNYNVEHVKKMIAYASERVKVIVAPVFTKGYNDEDMEDVIKWIKTLPKPPILGIQNFLRYKTSRNPAKELPWSEFYAMLERLEKKYDIKLRLQKEDFNIREIEPLPKPFVIGDEIKVVLKCEDRFPGASIGVAKGRNISIPNCEYKKHKKIRVAIMRDKHNVFTGRIVR